MMAMMVAIYNVLIRFSMMQNYLFFRIRRQLESSYLPDSNNLVIIRNKGNHFADFFRETCETEIKVLSLP